MPQQFTPPDPNYETRIRASFAKQSAMRTIGATIGDVHPGEVKIELPYSEDITQQDGFIHAGIITTIVDTACGYGCLHPHAHGFARLECGVQNQSNVSRHWRDFHCNRQGHQSRAHVDDLFRRGLGIQGREE